MTQPKRVLRPVRTDRSPLSAFVYLLETIIVPVTDFNLWVINTILGCIINRVTPERCS